MKITIWGTRGSIPTPLTSQSIREKIIAALEGAQGIDLTDPLAIRAYVDSLPPLIAGTAGGNTSCVELRVDDQLLVIDAGTGIRQLGNELMSGPCGRGQGVIHLFFSHTHWDHIQGFPFFVPAFIPGNRIYIYSVHYVEPTLADQMRPVTFPVSLKDMRATIEFVQLQEEQSYTIGNVSVTPLRLPHPGGSYAYRFEHRGRVVVYASDAEYKYLDDQYLQPFVRFYAGADVLIFDAQFTLRESLLKEDWGHSSALVGVDIARRAGVKRLVLFHHDPNSSDADLMNIVAQTVSYQASYEPSPSCEIMLATEGMTIDLEPVGIYSLHHPAEESALLIVSADFNQTAATAVFEQLSEGPSSTRLPRLVVDLSGVSQLSITCLRALIDLRRRWEGRPMALVGPSAQALQVIELARCADLFSIYPTVQAALAALEARDTLNLPGHTLNDRYCIEARIGESDLGIIFRATDLRLDRTVMIKVLSPLLSQRLARRLLREAQQMARLQAPHIVTLFDCDEDQGLAYMVMEYAGSRTLRDVMGQEQQWPPLSIALGMLRGLEYAHSRGVVHGNLKPENVLVADEVKLTDFALGRIAEDPELAEVAGLLGMPYYLAPEQIAGMPIDARTDLYALGVILYELFTGRRPFEGDRDEVREQHLYAAPIPPRTFNPEISRSLEYLILKLLAKDPDQRYASATQVRRVLSSLEIVPGHGEGSPAGLMQKRHRRLIGREVQLQRLLRLWRRVQQGEGQVVLIAGESGVGKTSLAEALAAQAHEALVVVGHCSELEGNPPYQPFVEIGREYLLRASPSELQRDLGDEAPVLAVLMPELHTLLPNLPAPVPLEPEQERLRLMHSFTQLIARASVVRPWLMILDDLHWADPASLEMLHYLARHIATMPLLIVGIYRDVELDRNHPLRELVRGLSRTQIYHHTVLDRLDQEGVRQLLQELLQSDVPEEWTAAIYRRTGGNPFYVEEVVRTLIDESAIALEDGLWRFAPVVLVRLPQSVRDIVLRRVARLSQPTQDLLRRAAVLGQQFSFADLLAVAEVPEDRLLEQIDEALGGDLLREVDAGTTLTFSHPEIQQVIYEDLSALRRRTLHRRVGEALELQHAQNPDAIAGQLAHHFIQAGDKQRGFTYSMCAAQQARSLHAYQTALNWYTQALEILPAESIDPATRVELYEGLGAMYDIQARYVEAVVAYTSMYEAAQAAGDVEAQARVWNGLNDVQVKQGDYRAALECAERAADIARQAGSQRELANALYGQGWALMKMGDAEQAVALGEQVLALSRELQAHDMIAKSLNLLGSVSSNLGHFDQAVSYYEQALAIHRHDANQRGLATILNNLGETMRTCGDYQGAIALYEEALAIATRTGNQTLQRTLLNNLAGARVGLGEYSSAEAELRQVIRSAEIDGWSGLSETYRFLGEAYLGQGRSDEALSAAQRALAWGQATGEQEQIGSAWRVLGMALARGNRNLAVTELALQNVALPGTAREGAPVDAACCFAESLRIFNETQMAAECARTLREWALFELEYGERSSGEDLWQKAYDLFIRLGMQLEAQRMSLLRPQMTLAPDIDR